MEHQKTALPLHQLIVVIVGLMALSCVVGGIVAIVYAAQSPTEFNFLGVTLTTGHVGVALVAIGVLVGLFTFRAVLNNQRDLAALPGDARRRRNRQRGLT